MAYKNFTRAVTLLIVVNLLIKLIWIFFVERNVQLSVGFEAFGMYYSVFNLTLILGVINDPGLNNYLINYVSKEKDTGRTISEIFYFKLFLSAGYVVVSIGVSYLIGFKDYQLLLLLVIYQLAFSFLGYLRSFLKAYQFLNAEVLFSVIDKGILIFLLLPLLYVDNGFVWTIHFYVICQIAALLLGVALCSYYLNKKNIKVFYLKHISFNVIILKKLFPFATFAFMVLAYNRLDAVMLKKMLPNGAMQTGIYAAAYRFLDAASMLPILFASLFYPVICKAIGNHQKIGQLIKSSLSFLLSLSVIIATSACFYRQPIMDLLYGQNATPQLALIFGVLMCSLPLIVIYYVFSTVFTANNNLKALNIVSAMGLCINILLNILLIPNYQVLGAAVSSFVSFSSIGLTYILLYHTYFKYKFDGFFWFKMVLFVFLLTALGYLLFYLTLVWMLSFAVYLILSTTLAATFNFFDVRTLRNSIKMKD